MKQSIYQAALDCSHYSKKRVAFFKTKQQGDLWYVVKGADKQYESLLLTLVIWPKRSINYLQIH